MKKIYKRCTFIRKSDVSQSFLVYNGSSFLKVVVSEQMVGRKFGEYAFTRQLFKFKKSNKR